MPRYKLRTLLILVAIAPPALGFAARFAKENFFIAALTLLWSLAFFTSVVSSHATNVALVGLTAAEWLVILAVVSCIGYLCLPTDPCFYGGCRE